MYLLAYEYTCMHARVPEVEIGDDRKKKQNIQVYLCLSMSKECLRQRFFGGNWSKPKWTPWLLGRMLHPAERDLGQRRGLRGLRGRD